MIVALCPLDNGFDTEANLAAIERQLAIAAQGGAALALFPECGLTGFKARSDLSQEPLRAAWTALQASVARHCIAALVPSIELDRSGRPRNRARLIGADGTLLSIFEKAGLTRPEQTWFATGDVARRRSFVLGGLRFGVLFCIELDAAAERYIDEPVDAVLWPSFWGHGEPFDWADAGPHEAYARMRDRARVWGAPLLQANFRRPDGNLREQDGSVLGGSVAVAIDGSLLHPFAPHRSRPMLVEIDSAPR